MILFTVKDSDLRNVVLSVGPERIGGGSIFPFFGESGQVKLLMVLLPEERQVLMLPRKRGIVSISLGGVVKLPMDLAELKSYANFKPELLDDLYHYDPDWALSQERFASYRPREAIRRTNCVEWIGGKIRHLQFSRDLSALESLAMESGTWDLSFRSRKPEEMFKEAVKPEKESPQVQRGIGGQWLLDPVWNNWHGFTKQEP